MDAWLSTLLLLSIGCRGSLGQTDDEIRAAAGEIWAADQYRFPEGDAVLDVDGARLFEYVNEGRMGGTPIYQYLRNLFPHYTAALGTADVCSEACLAAQEAFIDEMYNRDNRPMQLAQHFLATHGLAPSDVAEFKAMLQQYWFQPYSRGGSGVLDSSGFEHTFLGEINEDGSQVVGFYNWVMTYYEEKAGRFFYQENLDECYPTNLRMSFAWQGGSKVNSSMFVRTTPEVEMALYTMCFLTRPGEDCELELEGVTNVIRVYAHEDGATVGEAYPLCDGSISQGGPPSQEALNDVTNRIWAADAYRFPQDELIVNTQGPNLFEYVNEALFSQPPFAAFLPLLDNYEYQVGTPEVCGQPCWEEEEAFMDAILSQPASPMRIAQDFLVEHGLASAEREEFKSELRDWWFQLYSRSQGAALDSSGFEHVFLGEIRSGSNVLGLHNWVYVYYEEKEGNFVYGQLQNTCEPDQLKFSHSWHDYEKPVNSVMLGSSPDAELAVLTVCFLSRQTSQCDIMLQDIPNAVTTYDFAGTTPRTVGTAYFRCD